MTAQIAMSSTIAASTMASERPRVLPYAVA
jgi:hypothetical protein